jgi:hypothetical protein
MAGVEGQGQPDAPPSLDMALFRKDGLFRGKFCFWGL